MQVKIGIRFHRAEINFEINRLYVYSEQSIYAKEFSFDKSSSIKYMFFFFSYHPWIAASEGRSLTTQDQQPCPVLLEFRHSSPRLCENHKKP